MYGFPKSVANRINAVVIDTANSTRLCSRLQQRWEHVSYLEVTCLQHQVPLSSSSSCQHESAPGVRISSFCPETMHAFSNDETGFDYKSLVFI